DAAEISLETRRNIPHFATDTAPHIITALLRQLLDQNGTLTVLFEQDQACQLELKGQLEILPITWRFPLLKLPPSEASLLLSREFLEPFVSLHHASRKREAELLEHIGLLNQHLSSLEAIYELEIGRKPPPGQHLKAFDMNQFQSWLGVDWQAVGSTPISDMTFGHLRMARSGLDLAKVKHLVKVETTQSVLVQESVDVVEVVRKRSVSAESSQLEQSSAADDSQQLEQRRQERIAQVAAMQLKQKQKKKKIF
ncbi:hypothetical protein HDU91_000269, partial [Kappamyces sp. JEL0680]